MKKFGRLSRTIGTVASRCVTRFPVAFVFVLALTACLIALVSCDGFDRDTRLTSVLLYYLSVGTALSLSLHLWAEEVRSRRIRLGVQVAAHLLLLADALFCYFYDAAAAAADVAMAHIAMPVVIVLSVFVLSFLREKDDVAASNFSRTALWLLLLSIFVGMVMTGGLWLLTFSLERLFALTVSDNVYISIVIVCCLTLPALMVLGLLPSGEGKHDRRRGIPSLLHGLLKYLFLPLTGLYMIVLYVYGLSIVVSWQLPDGWVSWMVIVMMALCIAIVALIYPSLGNEADKFDQYVSRLLPALALPLLVLMSVGIGRRFMDYGVTINRLYLATLNMWFYIVCIGLVAGRVRRIIWIPVSFALLLALTSLLPVNYSSITRDVLRRQVKEALSQSGAAAFPLSGEEYMSLASAFTADGFDHINGKLSYLDEYFGADSYDDMVEAGVAFDIVMAEPDTLYTYVGSDNEIMTYSRAGAMTVQLSEEYAFCTKISIDTMMAERFAIDSVLVCPLGYADDTAIIPLDTLRSYDCDGERPMPLLKTQRGNRVMIDHYYIQIDYDEGRIDCSMQGHLFHN